MIDLETMGNTPNAAILQVAAVLFDPTPGGELVGTEDEGAFYMHAQLRGQERGVDAETILWWLAQKEAARTAVITGQQLAEPLLRVLHRLSDWFKVNRPERVWSHGADFDIPILKSAYARYDIRLPWRYNEGRCTRTLFEQHQAPEKIPFKGMKHCALDDARHQARKVQSALL
jgi:exodeoxyribonuclease VIII